MREINHSARLKVVNQKFKLRQSETFVRGRTKVFKIAGSVRKRFLPLSFPPPPPPPQPTSPFCARPISRTARNQKIAFRLLCSGYRAKSLQCSWSPVQLLIKSPPLRPHDNDKNNNNSNNKS